MARPVRSRQAACVSASSGAEPEMKSRMFAAARASGPDDRGAAYRRSARPSATSRRGNAAITASGSKLVLEDHRRAGKQRDIDRDEQAMGVKDGQRVDQPVRRREPPDVDQASARSTTGSRGSASRPSSGRSCPRCRGSPPDRRRRAALVSNSAAAAAIASAKVPSRATPRLSTARRPSCCVSAQAAERPGRQTVSAGSASLRKILELGERIGGVERQQRRARPEARERQHDHVGRLVDLRRDAVAGLDPERDQRVRRLRGTS